MDMMRTILAAAQELGLPPRDRRGWIPSSAPERSATPNRELHGYDVPAMPSRPGHVQLQRPPQPAMMDMPDHPNNWHAALNRPQERATASSNQVVRHSVSEFHALGVTRVCDPSFAVATSFGPVSMDDSAPVAPPTEYIAGICQSSLFPSYLTGVREQMQVITPRREAV